LRSSEALRFKHGCEVPHNFGPNPHNWDTPKKDVDILKHVDSAVELKLLNLSRVDFLIELIKQGERLLYIKRGTLPWPKLYEVRRCQSQYGFRCTIESSSLDAANLRESAAQFSRWTCCIAVRWVREAQQL
jgi:hypothetical protein